MKDLMLAFKASSIMHLDRNKGYFALAVIDVSEDFTPSEIAQILEMLGKNQKDPWYFYNLFEPTKAKYPDTSYWKRWAQAFLDHHSPPRNPQRQKQ